MKRYIKADASKAILDIFEKGRTKHGGQIRPHWRGCDNIDMVWYNSQSDPGLLYNGYEFNYYDIEDALFGMNLKIIRDIAILNYSTQLRSKSLTIGLNRGMLKHIWKIVSQAGTLEMVIPTG